MLSTNYVHSALRLLEATKKASVHPDSSCKPHFYFVNCEAIVSMLSEAERRGYYGPEDISETCYLVSLVLKSKDWWDIVRRLKEAAASVK